MEIVKSYYEFIDKYGLPSVQIFKEDRAAKLDLLYAIRVAEEALVVESEGNGVIQCVMPDYKNAIFEICAVTVGDIDKCVSVTVHPISKKSKACICVVKGDKYKRNNHRWLTPEDVEKLDRRIDYINNYHQDE